MYTFTRKQIKALFQSVVRETKQSKEVFRWLADSNTKQQKGAIGPEQGETRSLKEIRDI